MIVFLFLPVFFCPSFFVLNFISHNCRSPFNISIIFAKIPSVYFFLNKSWCSLNNDYSVDRKDNMSYVIWKSSAKVLWRMKIASFYICHLIPGKCMAVLKSYTQRVCLCYSMVTIISLNLSRLLVDSFNIPFVWLQKTWFMHYAKTKCNCLTLWNHFNVCKAYFMA